MSQSTNVLAPARVQHTAPFWIRLTQPVPLLGKELHALLPFAAKFWALLFLSAAAASTLDAHLLWVGVVYVLGCMGLGSMSMGHEFSSKTWWLVLGQPLDRMRLWGRKAIALAAALALSAMVYALTWVCMGRDSQQIGDTTGSVTIILCLGAWLGFTIAPTATLLLRNTGYSVVLTVTVVLGMEVALWLHVLGRVDRGWLPPEAANPMFFTLSGLLLGIVGIVALPAGILRFLRLEIIEGERPLPGLPSWITKVFRGASQTHAQSRGGRRSALWKKELRLQIPAMVFFLVVILLAAWSAFSRSAESVFGSMEPSSLFVAMGTISVIVSSAFSASEERSLGVWTSQATLPVAAWKQWACKTAVSMGVALFGGLLLPTALILVYRTLGWTDAELPSLRTADSWLFVYALVTACGVCLLTSASSNHAVPAFLLAGLGLVLAMAGCGFGASKAWYFMFQDPSQEYLIATTVPSQTGAAALLRALVTGDYSTLDPGRLSSIRTVLGGVVFLAAAGLLLLPPWLGYRQNRRESGRVIPLCIALGTITLLAWLMGTAASLLPPEAGS